MMGIIELWIGEYQWVVRMISLSFLLSTSLLCTTCVRVWNRNKYSTVQCRRARACVGVFEVCGNCRVLRAVLMCVCGGVYLTDLS